MLRYDKGTIYVKGNGKVITSDVTPKFGGWTYDMYLDFNIKFLEPMTCKEGNLEDTGEDKIAEIKWDGHRALCHVTPNGNRFFSRRISKKTGWYAENTDCLPHLRDSKSLDAYMGTVLDGEIVMNTRGTKDVQGVMGALPATALHKQIDCGFATYQVFDILYYKGINIQMLPLWKRKLYLHKVLKDNWNPCIREAKFFGTRETLKKFVELKKSHIEGKWLFDPVPSIIESFKKFCSKVWEDGEEGIILKDIFAPYVQKRSSNMLKLKGIIHKDVVVMGFGEPTKFYSGKSLDEGTWSYWVDAEDDNLIITEELSAEEADEQGLFAVTKPYAMGWVGSIVGGVWKKGKLVEVVEVLGITDELQVDIKKTPKKYIGSCIEVEAQEVLSVETGSLRHPRFSRLRTDKNAKSCTWEDYIEVN